MKVAYSIGRHPVNMNKIHARTSILTHQETRLIKRLQSMHRQWTCTELFKPGNYGFIHFIVDNNPGPDRLTDPRL